MHITGTEVKRLPRDLLQQQLLPFNHRMEPKLGSKMQSPKNQIDFKKQIGFVDLVYRNKKETVLQKIAEPTPVDSSRFKLG